MLLNFVELGFAAAGIMAALLAEDARWARYRTRLWLIFVVAAAGVVTTGYAGATALALP